jgi:hypothetical protein
MLLLALGLFAVAALGGVLLAYLRVQSTRNPPLGVALVHGAVAAAGLLLLLSQVVTGMAVGTLPYAAVGLLVLAALGGFVLFGLHVRGTPIPLPGVAVHALAAVLGFLALAVAALG